MVHAENFFLVTRVCTAVPFSLVDELASTEIMIGQLLRRGEGLKRRGYDVQKSEMTATSLLFYK